MANRYDSFEVFMVEVINKANSISNLNQLFDVKYDTLVSKLNDIIKMGWWVFLAICVLLPLGPITFFATLGTFLLTPPGVIIAGIFGIAAATVVREMYRNKELPLAIKRIGARYEPKWKEAQGDTYMINRIFEDAVRDLLFSGKHSLSSFALHLLSSTYFGNP